MKKSERRIWNNEELTIAYYITKWGYSGLDISEEDLVNGVIGNTTAASLLKQTANFRDIMNIEGFKLGNGQAQPAKEAVVEELKNMTMTQVRKLVISKIESSEESIKSFNKNLAKTELNKRVIDLNNNLNDIHNKKVAALLSHRNLKRIN